MPVISTVTDQATVPHATFPVVAYAIAAAGAAYAVARRVLSRRQSVLLGLVSGALVVMGAVEGEQQRGRRAGGRKNGEGSYDVRPDGLHRWRGC